MLSAQDDFFFQRRGDAVFGQVHSCRGYAQRLCDFRSGQVFDDIEVEDLKLAFIEWVAEAVQSSRQISSLLGPNHFWSVFIMCLKGTATRVSEVQARPKARKTAQRLRSSRPDSGPDCTAGF
jgi:hypothetical protein